MLVVHGPALVRPERVEDFLAATLVNARASERYSAVFPEAGEGWASGPP
jgi:hypothetical protein